MTAGCALVALLRPVPPITLALLRSALGRFLGRWYLTYSHSSPGAVDRAGDVPALWQVGTVSCSLRVTVLYPNSRLTSSGLLPWSRGLRARAAGGSLHTGAILKALSAGGVSGSLSIGGHAQPQGGSSSLEGSALLHKLEVVPKFPKYTKYDCVQSLPPQLEKPSINHPLV